MYKAYLKNKSITLENKYKLYKNKLITILRQAEKKYYSDKLNKVQGNMHKTWTVLNEIIGKKRDHKTIEQLEINNKTIVNKQLIADKFNDFFVNIGPSLADKIPIGTKTVSNYLSENSNTDSIFLSPTTEVEIRNIIHDLKNTGNSGPRDLPSKVIKHCDIELSPILVYLNNESISDGVFPDQLKIARVTPIHKAGDTKCLTNYRPISVLPIFSKISEKLINTRLLDFLTKYSILSNSQYGFRPKLSTSMALLQLVEDLSRAMDEGDYAVGVFIDLAKAFDTVNHGILLSKLEHYGIRGRPLEWFKSYLSNRQQYVQIGHHKSNRTKIKCGVPQGSILGPILFLIYINDLNNIVNKARTIMFADDTNLFFTGKSALELENTINFELQIVNEWFKTNLLSLNVSKTSYIIFCHNNKRNININCKIQDIPITRQYDTKFLGVILSSD